MRYYLVYSTCYELKNSEETSHIPVLMLTSLGDSSEGKTAPEIISMGHKADAYLEKPVEIDDLMEKVQELIEKGQTQTEVLNNASKPYTDYVNKHNETTFTSQDRVNKSNQKIKKLESRYNRVKDSVGKANKVMNLRFDGINKQRTKLNKQQSDILSGNY